MCVVGLGLIVVVLGGFLLLAGYLPPPIHANDSADEVADFYAKHTDAIRAGLVVGFCGWTPWAALTAVISVQLARMQPQRPVLAILQAILGAAGFVFLLMSMIILLAATFRPERAPRSPRPCTTSAGSPCSSPSPPYAVSGSAGDAHRVAWLPDGNAV